MRTVPIGLEGLVEKVRAGLRLSGAEALELYRSAPTAILGALADGIRLRKHPDGLVTYIIDRNVNYTNICVAKCNFCAFYPVDRRTATCLDSTSSFARSTKPSRSAVFSCCCRAVTIRTCRCPGTKTCSGRSKSAIRRSSFMRCRHPRSFTCRVCHSCRCLPSSIG